MDCMLLWTIVGSYPEGCLLRDVTWEEVLRQVRALKEHLFDACYRASIAVYRDDFETLLLETSI